MADSKPKATLAERSKPYDEAGQTPQETIRTKDQPLNDQEKSVNTPAENRS